MTDKKLIDWSLEFLKENEEIMKIVKEGFLSLTTRKIDKNLYYKFRGYKSNRICKYYPIYSSREYDQRNLYRTLLCNREQFQLPLEIFNEFLISQFYKLKNVICSREGWKGYDYWDKENNITFKRCLLMEGTSHLPYCNIYYLQEKNESYKDYIHKKSKYNIDHKEFSVYGILDDSIIKARIEMIVNPYSLKDIANCFFRIYMKEDFLKHVNFI